MTVSEKEELITLLNKCWMTHDGLWFYQCLQELGIEKTNRINKAAIKALAEIEVGRAKKFLGVEGERLDTFEEFKDFLASVSEFFIPDFMNASMSFPKANVLRWEFKPGECFAYKGMQGIGVIDDYECGVIYRLECWIESLGIPYDINPPVKKCLMLDSGQCSGDFTLHF